METNNRWRVRVGDLLKGLVFVLLLVLVSCNAKKQTPTVEEKVIAEKTADWELDVRFPVFTSADVKVNSQLEKLNQHLESHVEGLQQTFKQQAGELFRGLEAAGLPRPAWGCSLQITDSLFWLSESFVSVRLTVYRFTGGAHGAIDFFAFNYDLEKQQLLAVPDLFRSDKQVEVDALLREYLENPQQCFDTDPRLDLVSVVNITPESFCFTFGHYMLGPYACGTAEITVPKAAFANYLISAY